MRPDYGASTYEQVDDSGLPHGGNVHMYPSAHCGSQFPPSHGDQHTYPPSGGHEIHNPWLQGPWSGPPSLHVFHGSHAQLIEPPQLSSTESQVYTGLPHASA